jgi:hypothetical protein
MHGHSKPTKEDEIRMVPATARGRDIRKIPATEGANLIEGLVAIN